MFIFTVNKVFISGPVVVSTPGYIQFKAIYRKESQSLQAKWIKTKDEKSTEINLLEQGYSVLNSGSGVLQIQSVNIPSVPENFGTYQLYLKDDMKSNKITVIEYGIAIHVYTTQFHLLLIVQYIIFLCPFREYFIAFH